jgi:tRNA threonylcarbamoyladenosine biosynthesis protein TsaE
VSQSESEDSAAVFLAISEAQTDRLAAAFVGLLERGDVVAFEGTLGAGKTRFVRGLAQALHADRSLVSSPTFGLVHHYDGDLPLVHIDAYRLSDSAEFERMGGAELFDPEGVTLIEWSERIAGGLPRERWVVTARHVGETMREYRISSTHRNHPARIGRLAAVLRAEGNGERPVSG